MIELKIHRYTDLSVSTHLKGWRRGERDCCFGKDCCCSKERTTGGKYNLLAVKVLDKEVLD